MLRTFAVGRHQVSLGRSRQALQMRLLALVCDSADAGHKDELFPASSFV